MPQYGQLKCLCCVSIASMPTLERQRLERAVQETPGCGSLVRHLFSYLSSRLNGNALPQYTPVPQDDDEEIVARTAASNSDKDEVEMTDTAGLLENGFDH